MDSIFDPDNKRPLQVLSKKAEKVLERNWTGSFTKPTSHLYPFQWSWDSAFIAIGYAHYKPERAVQELRSLFSAQWDNGMVPQIIFYDSREADKYFPGPEFWQTELAENAPKIPKTSGICQPPIHATALLHLLKYSPDQKKAEEFAKELFPKLKKWHAYLYRERNPWDEGLVYIRHPWGSGQDNSPLWDEVLKRINLGPDEIPEYERKDTELIHVDERPSDYDYDRYVYLLDFFRKRNYNEEKIREDDCPFLIQDVLFNTLLCRAHFDLADIAERIGKNPEPFRAQARQTAEAMNQKLWDQKHDMYINYNINSGEQVHAHVLAGFLPLFAGIPDKSRAQKMFDYLNTKCFCRMDENCLAAPSYDRSGTGYSKTQYWRGPIWINMNWMLAEGLDRYGYSGYAEKVRESILELASNSGFHEYFDPDSGKGYGTDNFSWTAALLIDIVERYRDSDLP